MTVRFGRWWRGSLQRWLLLPFACGAILVAVLVGVGGYRVIERSLLQLQTDYAAMASQAAVNALESRATGLAAATAEMARHESVRVALKNGQSADALADVRASARLQGLEAAALVDTSDESLESLATGLRLESLVEGGGQVFLNTSVGDSIRRLLAAAQPEDHIELGIATTQGPTLLYAASPIFDGTRLQSVLVTGVKIDSVVPSASPSAASVTVMYDAEGRPLYSSSLGADRLASVGQVDAGAAVQGLQHVTLAGESFVYVLRPVVVGTQRLGYLAAWQPWSTVDAYVGTVQLIWLVLVGLSTLSLLALSLWLTARVVKPVRALVVASKALSTGESFAYVPVSPIRELGMLAESFNQMSEEVHRQTGILRDQAGRANYLFEASAELGRTLDLEESLQTAAEAIYGLGGLSYVVLFTGRGELGPYCCRAVRGLSPETIARMLGQEYPVPLWGVMARALVGRQPLVVDDIAAQNRPRPGEFDWDVGQGSLLLFPISGAEGPSALIMAGASEAGAFADGDLGDLVFALARIASQSVRNAQLYQEAVRSQEQLVTLQMISKLVASVTQIEALLQVVVREAAEVMGNSQAWLLLRDPATETTRLYGQSGSAEAGLWTNVHQDATTWVLRAGQPIFYHPDKNLAQSPILVHHGPAVCVPLEVNDETIGALVVMSRDRQRNFVEDDMIVLRTLTNAAASGLRTAQVTQRFHTEYVELAQAWAARVDLAIWGRRGHGARVATNALALGQAAGLSPAQNPSLEIAAYLHDIALESATEEREVGAGPAPPHAVAGAEWLADAGLDARVVSLVRNHHLARPDLVLADGDGGLAASILALVNAVDTWLAGNGESPPLTPAEVRERLVADAGRCFAPGLAADLAKLWAAGQLAVPQR